MHTDRSLWTLQGIGTVLQTNDAGAPASDTTTALLRLICSVSIARGSREGLTGAGQRCLASTSTRRSFTPVDLCSPGREDGDLDASVSELNQYRPHTAARPALGDTPHARGSLDGGLRASSSTKTTAGRRSPQGREARGHRGVSTRIVVALPAASAVSVSRRAGTRALYNARLAAVCLNICLMLRFGRPLLPRFHFRLGRRSASSSSPASSHPSSSSTSSGSAGFSPWTVLAVSAVNAGLVRPPTARADTQLLAAGLYLRSEVCDAAAQLDAQLQPVRSAAGETSARLAALEATVRRLERRIIPVQITGRVPEFAAKRAEGRRSLGEVGRSKGPGGEAGTGIKEVREVAERADGSRGRRSEARRLARQRRRARRSAREKRRRRPKRDRRGGRSQRQIRS